MDIAVDFGRERAGLAVADLLGAQAAPTPLDDPAAALRAALERPFGFPPLRKALTPDDHVAVVVDEGLPDVAGLLTPLLEHLAGAGVGPSAVTLLVPPSASGQPWLDDLPD